MRVAELEEMPLPEGDPRSVRQLTDLASRAWQRSSYFDAFALYRLLCHREPDEPRHAHRAAEMCIKLAEPMVALVYLRRALERYAAKGQSAFAIAVARLGLSISPDDLAFKEKLGTLLTIRENERWTNPGTAPATLAQNNTDDLRSLRPEQWMEPRRVAPMPEEAPVLTPTTPSGAPSPGLEIDFDALLAKR